MRILFTCIWSYIHFMPLLPFARALKDRGQNENSGAIAELAEEINKRGFDRLVLDAPTEAQRETFSKSIEGIPASELGKFYVLGFFMAVLARTALPGLLDSLHEWRPELIVRDPTEFSGLLAAQKLGIPHVRLEILNGESEESIASNYHEEFDALRADVGLPLLGAGYLKDEPAFSAHPAILDDTTKVNTRCPTRVLVDGVPQQNDISEASWAPKGDKPLIYDTFGTVAAGNAATVSIYRHSLEAFADLPMEVLLTTGNDVPDDLCSDAPPNVTVRAFVPQADVLPHARLMVCHGGSGTVIAGLAAGVPMVIAPLFADQPGNARCLADAGVCLSVPKACAASLRSAIERALSDEGLRESARAASKVIATMPDLDRAVDLILDTAR